MSQGYFVQDRQRASDEDHFAFVFGQRKASPATARLFRETMAARATEPLARCVVQAVALSDDNVHSITQAQLAIYLFNAANVPESLTARACAFAIDKGWLAETAGGLCVLDRECRDAAGAAAAGKPAPSRRRRRGITALELAERITGDREAAATLKRRWDGLKGFYPADIGSRRVRGGHAKEYDPKALYERASARGDVPNKLAERIENGFTSAAGKALKERKCRQSGKNAHR